MDTILNDKDVSFLTNYKNVFFEDGKILFEFKSIFNNLLIIIIWFSLLYFLFDYFPQKGFLLFLSMFTLTAVSILIKIIIFQSPYRVIDFYKKSIYYRYSFFFIPFNIWETESFDILKICNNVVVHSLDPNKRDRSGHLLEGPLKPRHPETKYFHHYFVSFFLKNGEIYNFLPIGWNENNHEDSIKLAELISKYWNIELFTCPSNQYLISEYMNLKAVNILD